LNSLAPPAVNSAAGKNPSRRNDNAPSLNPLSINPMINPVSSHPSASVRIRPHPSASVRNFGAEVSSIKATAQGKACLTSSSI
jgi:hypothetical protein